MTSPQQPHGRLRCPKCHGPVYIANVDDVDTILCMDDGCRWKMQVVEEQPPTPQQPASKLLKAIISECQGEVDCELRGNAKDLAKRILYYIQRE